MPPKSSRIAKVVPDYFWRALTTLDQTISVYLLSKRPPCPIRHSHITSYDSAKRGMLIGSPMILAQNS
jgi:hypothetical protein